MSKYELLVPKTARELINYVVDQARATLEKNGALSPIAFCGKFDGGEINIVSGIANVSKDKGAAAIRAVAKKTDADFVIFIDECWVYEAKGKTREDAQRIREQYAQVKDIPGRVDAIMFVVQTHAATFSAAERRLDAGKFGLKYTFGEVDFEMFDHAEGRFMNLLPPRDTKQ